MGVAQEGMEVQEEAAQCLSQATVG